MEVISQEFNEIKRLSDNVLQNVGDTGTAIAQYTNMINMVNSFARQINLLSLNATIEAARVGASGRAFAVAVDGIRKLSVESQNSINEVPDTASFAAKSIESINKSSAEVDQSINKALEFFSSILQSKN